MTCILKLNLYTIPNPIKKVTLSTKLIMKMKTLNFNTNTFTKMTKNDRMNNILFMHITINIQSEKKATSHINDLFNMESTSNLTIINKITNNKTISNQTINDHNH